MMKSERHVCDVYRSRVSNSTRELGGHWTCFSNSVNEGYLMRNIMVFRRCVFDADEAYVRCTCTSPPPQDEGSLILSIIKSLFHKYEYSVYL